MWYIIIDILLVISYDENPVVMHEKKLENYKILLEFSIDYDQKNGKKQLYKYKFKIVR